MEIKIPITNRARKYGYLIWPKKKEDKLKKLIGDKDKITVTLNGYMLGTKNIGWKYCRISLGPQQTKGISVQANSFHLKITKSGELEIISY